MIELIEKDKSYYIPSPGEEINKAQLTSHLNKKDDEDVLVSVDLTEIKEEVEIEINEENHTSHPQNIEEAKEEINVNFGVNFGASDEEDEEDEEDEDDTDKKTLEPINEEHIIDYKTEGIESMINFEIDSENEDENIDEHVDVSDFEIDMEDEIEEDTSQTSIDSFFEDRSDDTESPAMEDTSLDFINELNEFEEPKLEQVIEAENITNVEEIKENEIKSVDDVVNASADIEDDDEFDIASLGFGDSDDEDDEDFGIIATENETVVSETKKDSNIEVSSGLEGISIEIADNFSFGGESDEIDSKHAIEKNLQSLKKIIDIKDFE